MEELLHAEETSCTCTMAKCVHAAGWQWAVKREEEGGRKKRREKQAGQTLLGGQAGRDAHPSAQQKQGIPDSPSPPPPFTLPNFSLERRASELATRGVVVVNTTKKAKRRRGGLMINSKKYYAKPICS
jgi:hypothetical protein